MKIYPQPKPNTMKIEPTEGCTLACWFCAIQSIRENGASRDDQLNGQKSAPFKFMTKETMDRITLEVEKLDWAMRWEIAGRGEPTVNMNLEYLVQRIRERSPKSTIILTTNGSGLFRRLERIQKLFDAGLNILALDDYKHADFVAPIIQHFKDLEGVRDYEVMRYPEQPEANIYRRVEPDLKRVVILRDISLGGGVRNLTNQGGASGSAKADLHEPCAKPFREITFRFDGHLALCCDDWPGIFKVPGNINTDSLLSLWHSKQMEAARRNLLRGERTFGPCQGCDVRTKRNGLLPDKMGQDRGKMAMPDAESKAIIAKACAGPVLTPKIGGAS